jgi:5'-deoxynucleotidase YfbR-like HD superfamily hydrolase
MSGDYVEDARGPIVTMYPSGAELHPFDASPDEIHLEDIAHHLSLVCRFGGAVREFYSVAQHSVLVMRLATDPSCADDSDEHLDILRDPRLRPLALMHDAAEYVFGDMTAPVKSRCLDYKKHEEAFEARIFQAYGIEKTEALWRIVKRADRFMRRVEADYLGKARIAYDEREAKPVPEVARALLDRAWTADEAEDRFLAEAGRWFRCTSRDRVVFGSRWVR